MSMNAELKRWLSGTSKYNALTSGIGFVVGLLLLCWDGTDLSQLVGFAVTVAAGFDLVKRYRLRHED
ncbi:MAG: hypothetical protein ACHP7O_05105 [Burkholderiales bacterium]